MQTIQNTSSKASQARQAYVDEFLPQHVWHEFATLSLKSPMVTPEQVTRVIQFFDDWCTERVFDCAEQLGLVKKTFVPKHYQSDWERVEYRSTTKEHRPNPELSLVKYGLQGQPVTKLRRYWDAQGSDFEGDDKGWKEEQVQVRHVRWVGEFVRRWKRYKTTMKPIYVLGIERHKSGAVHIHAVIHHRIFADEIRRDRGFWAWKRRYGRARIEPVQSQGDVAGYVSKYCIKDYYNEDPRQEAELIFSKFFGEHPLEPHNAPVATASRRRPRLSSLVDPAAPDVALWDESELTPSSPTNRITSARTGSGSQRSVLTKRRSQPEPERDKEKQKGSILIEPRGSAAKRAWLAAAAPDLEKMRKLFQPGEPEMVKPDQSPGRDVAVVR